MVIEIEGRKIGLGHPPYIIAELSANHNGSLQRALDTIDAAKACGVDAVKLQTYTADTITMDSDSPEFMIKGGLWDGFKLYDLYKWAETPYEWHEELFAHARKRGITVFSTPFDETAVDLLENLGTPAYKIASFELVDLPLIRYASDTGKPLIISTGMASISEVEEAVEAARDSGCKELILLHCVSSYPTPIEQSNLFQIPEISQKFGLLTGLSDHTLGTTAAVASVALGASVIEKHFTLNRSDKGPDSEFSLEPKDLTKLTKDAKDAWLALGNRSFQRQKVEEDSKIFRRSLYFTKDLEAGHLISDKDICRIRPGFGLSPKHMPEVLGKKLKVSVKRASAVSWDVF